MSEMPQLDSTLSARFPDVIKAAEEFARQLKLANLRDVNVMGVGFVGPAEKRGFNDALEQVALEYAQKSKDELAHGSVNLGHIFARIEAHVRSMKKP